MVIEQDRKDAGDLAYTLERFGFEAFVEQYAKERTDRCEKRSAILGNNTLFENGDSHTNPSTGGKLTVEAKLVIALKALEWYANEDGYVPPVGSIGRYAPARIEQDGGKVARTTLKKLLNNVN